MTYASVVLAHVSVPKSRLLQNIQNRFLRIATGCPWYVRNIDLHRDFDLPSIRKFMKDVSLAARGTSSSTVMTKSLSPTQTRPRTLHSHKLAPTHQHTALVGQECEDPRYEFTRATGAFLHPPLSGAPQPRFRPIGRPQVGVVPFGPA
jgi:hypothetical protein